MMLIQLDAFHIRNCKVIHHLKRARGSWVENRNRLLRPSVRDAWCWRTDSPACPLPSTVFNRMCGSWVLLRTLKRPFVSSHGPTVSQFTTCGVGGYRSTAHNAACTFSLVSYLSVLCSYFTGDTLRLHYRVQPVNVM
jgi:hypothetical protein